MSTLSVAKISGELADELGLDFKDNDDNYVISLCLASQLGSDEFNVIPADITGKGTLPVDPTKPLIRPKKK